MMTLLQNAAEGHQPFAPPFLKDGDALIGQTAAISFCLRPDFGLAPHSELERLWAHQIELTINDLIGEVHDTHHPSAVSLLRRPEAGGLPWAEGFRTRRIPKYLGWFEKHPEAKPERKCDLIGESITYAYLSLFHAIEGLSDAFPRAMKRLLPDYFTRGSSSRRRRSTPHQGLSRQRNAACLLARRTSSVAIPSWMASCLALFSGA